MIVLIFVFLLILFFFFLLLFFFFFFVLILVLLQILTVKPKSQIPTIPKNVDVFRRLLPLRIKLDIAENLLVLQEVLPVILAVFPVEVVVGEADLLLDAQVLVAHVLDLDGDVSP
ncbi:hypothetical protein TorRG33x02_298900 [Trema orientale]|uniref:Uncharacterized protein n=1 Tax=Trema orientale TaxID=63057 RepID=A0A2P5C3G6_TREOI|nr:hypothetical protein TorRG33x02_298900 [Trema orientale]